MCGKATTWLRCDPSARVEWCCGGGGGGDLAVMERVHAVEDLWGEASGEEALEAAILADLRDKRDALAEDVREDDDGDEEEHGKHLPVVVRHDVYPHGGGDRRRSGHTTLPCACGKRC